jgi:hypothetical protein
MGRHRLPSHSPFLYSVSFFVGLTMFVATPFFHQLKNYNTTYMPNMKDDPDPSTTDTDEEMPYISSKHGSASNQDNSHHNSDAMPIEDEEEEMCYLCPLCGKETYALTLDLAKYDHEREADHLKEVVPGLYVGAEWHAENRHHLYECRIGKIVCMAQELCGKQMFPSLVYHMVPLYDETYEWIIPQLLSTTHWLIQNVPSVSSASVISPNNVLVHCKAGISRSVTAVAAFLLFQNPDHSVHQVLTTIRAARSIARPNPGYHLQLAILSHLFTIFQRQWNVLLCLSTFI